MLYADAAATTPVRREVLEAMWPYLTGEFANPSSVHEPGRRAAAALDGARREVAAAFGARPGEVIFTAGGTEANNLAIKGLALAAPAAGTLTAGSHVAGASRHIVTTAIEHEAVLQSVDYLRRYHGFEVSFAAVTPEGFVTPRALRAALRDDTALVTIHHANNEIGTIQDIAGLAAVAHEAGALFHTDAVQAAGWLNVALHVPGGALHVTDGAPQVPGGALRVPAGADHTPDAISISGHKIGAPKGIGALLLRSGVPLEPLIHGGGQERGHRSGTENVAFAVGLAAAVRGLAVLRARAPEVAAARDALITGVLGRVPGAILTGPDPRHAIGRGVGISADREARIGADRNPWDPLTGRDTGSRGYPTWTSTPAMVGRLPGHASFCFPGTSGEAVLLELERSGFVTSSGSACAAGRDEPSHVLLALGIPPEVAQTAVRLTVEAPFDATDVIDAIVSATAKVGALGR